MQCFKKVKDYKYLKVKHNYHSVLRRTQPREFLQKETRAHALLTHLTYKGQQIAVLIPLRANINPFKFKPHQYVQTANTDHTMPGNVAGWHITKMIPADSMLFKNLPAANVGMGQAENIAISQESEMHKKAQEHLNKIASGYKIFGALDFDKALKEKNKLMQELRAQGRLYTFEMGSVLKQTDLRIIYQCSNLEKLGDTLKDIKVFRSKPIEEMMAEDLNIPPIPPANPPAYFV